MILSRLTITTLCTLTTLMTPATYGNDIVDFLQALNGSGRRGHIHDHDRHFDRGHRGHRGHARRRGAHLHGRRPIVHPVDFNRRSVSINIGTRRPPVIYRPSVQPIVPAVPVYPTVPAYPAAPPHHIGEFVTCSVPIMPHVHVEDAHETHPHAQPVVIAVRSPHLPAWGTPGCVEQLVYVEVFVPPFPPEEVEVSPCHTKIELDYGKWEVKITSANGVIEVEYDD